MDIKINGVVHEVPSDISKITLGKFVEYYNKYGRDLDDQLSAIFEKEQEAIETEIDLQLHIDREALSWYSFFTGHNFFETTDVDLTDMLIQYRILRALLKDSEDETREYPFPVDWREEKWVIQDFRVQPGSDMSFNEILTGKEVARQISKLGQSKWEALPYLCAVYFRKEGELFTEDLTDGERLALMNGLPLTYAFAVAFFLNSSINIFRKHLLSSVSQEAEKTTQLN